MKAKKMNPHSPEVIEAAVEMIRRMTPEEALAFLTYRTPGVEETDMTGMFSGGQTLERTVSEERRVASV
jgi:hypothetical protein